ncbi:MAG: hypothetical protein ACI9W6_001355 [Motiliproteus sp.]|jgi:hypothetical protein
MTLSLKRYANYIFKRESEMTTNIGTIDRVFRLVLGIVLLAVQFVSGLSMFESSTATIVALVVGAVMIVTAAIKFCPLYRLLGLRTCKR